MRILVTGSRDWPGALAVWNALHRAYTTGGFTVVVGDCPSGVDAYARAWAEQYVMCGVALEQHFANWETCAPACQPGHRRLRRDGSTYCPAAGPRRNAAMVNAGADLCLAFPLGRSAGTRGCMRLAAAAGIPVKEHTP